MSGVIPWLLILVALAGAPQAGTFVTDGNVVGAGAEWTPDYQVLSDGDDDRVATPDYPGGYEFHDIEDIDEVLLWVDLASDSLRVAWKTLAPPYPNRSLVSYAGTENRGTFGLIIDVDAERSTGVLTDRTRADAPSYVTTTIGGELALALLFEGSMDELPVWTSTPWQLAGSVESPGPVPGNAAFGVTFDGSGLGANARWTEGAWSISVLRSLWEPVLGRTILGEGDLIAVAGLLSTPVVFGLEGEEITEGGYFLVGWGPVMQAGGEATTLAIHDAWGKLLIPAGLPIRYDSAAKRFLVNGEPTLPCLGEVIYGDVSGDRVVSAYDASLILRFIVGYPVDIPPIHADVSGNGNVTPYDAALILRRVIEPSYRFPVEEPVAQRRAAEEVMVHVVRTENGWELSVSSRESPWAAFFVIESSHAPAICGVTASEQRRDGALIRIAAIGEGRTPMRVFFPEEASAPHVVRAEINERPVFVPQSDDLAPLCVAPNPFNATVTLTYSLPEELDVSLTICDIAGRTVRLLPEGFQSAGAHRITWDGRDKTGHAVASGVYLARLRTGKTIRVARLVLVR